MKQATLIIILILLFCSCSKKQKSIVFFEEKNGQCAFVLNNNLNFYAQDNIPMTSSVTNVDSVDNSHDDAFFIKRSMPVTNFEFDSVYLANLIDINGDWLKKVILYNAKIFPNHWEVSIYYPFQYKGTYIFNVSDEEKMLYGSILSLCDTLSRDAYPNHHVVDSLINRYDHNHDFYFDIFHKGKEKSVFSYFSYFPQNVNRLYQLTSIIVYNHITELQKTNSFIGNLGVRNHFNQRFQEITGNPNANKYVYDIDTMRLLIDKLKR